MDFIGYVSDYKKLYSCSKLEYLKKNVHIWEKNRLIDYTRVSELTALYELENTLIVPGWISAFKKNDKIFIYDGSHRFQAMLNSGREMKMYITLVDDEKILTDFQSVNKMVPIPECYLSENAATELSERIVKHYSGLYPKFVSSSFRARKPNFNRDVLVDNLSKHLNGKGRQFDDVIRKLNDFNSKLKNNIINTKCEKYDFWLFSVPIQEMVKYI